MSALLLSVLGASLLGSLHCAGMCGGIVAFATTADGKSRSPDDGSSAASRNGRALPVLQPSRTLSAQTSVHAAYHGGRLLTYATLGALAGAVGSVLNLAGSLAGISELAAIAAGAVIVAWALGALLPARFRLALSSNESSVFSRALGKVARLPAGLRSLVLGMSTGLLPCGWLYAFVVAAAGTGSASSGALLMLAFWAGTVPVLLGVGSLAQLLGAKFRRHVPLLSAVVLLAVGFGNLWVRFDPTTNKLQSAVAAPFDATTDGAEGATPRPSCH